MKIVVCVKQSADGEINPFDASAYETALGIDGAEITLLSMGPEKTAPFLESLTRLGAKNAVLLCDRAFAGAGHPCNLVCFVPCDKKALPRFCFLRQTIGRRRYGAGGSVTCGAAGIFACNKRYVA